MTSPASDRHCETSAIKQQREAALNVAPYQQPLPFEAYFRNPVTDHASDAVVVSAESSHDSLPLRDVDDVDDEVVHGDR